MNVGEQIGTTLLKNYRDATYDATYANTITVNDAASALVAIGNRINDKLKNGNGTARESARLLRRAAMIALVHAAKLEGDA